MKRKIIREKQHRLPKEIYIGEKAVAFTICIKNNKRLFTTEKIYKVFEKELLNALIENNCSAYVYLFMPDHLHLIIKGENENSNIKKTVELFKQKTGFWLSNNLPYIKWQKDYYDHIIRNDEDIQNQIRYILNNPVRANIVENLKEYKFKGSTIFNLEEWE
ncbi:MAG: transposase [Ignavibacteriae bacterium]|nr:transposase [Ignavibacteriota bacterium]